MPFGGAFGYLGDYAVLWLMFLSLLLHTWVFLRFFPKNRPRFKLIVGNLLIFLCLIGVVAMVAETNMRFFLIRTDSFGVSLSARKWFAVYTRLNSMGCRDPEWSVAKPNGVRRIAVVGDSFTYGWGVEEESDRFTNVLHEKFEEARAGRVEMMNVAFPGWGSGDQAAPVMGMIEKYAVDEIVLAYVFNDIEKLLPTSPEFNPLRPPQPRWFNPDSSCVVDWLFRTFVLPRSPTVRGHAKWLADGFQNPDVWAEHRRQLLAIRDICQERGVAFRVVLIPFLRVGESYPRERLHEQLSHFLRGESIEFVDLLPVVANRNPRELAVNHLDAHPNVEAHRLFAEAIWNAFYLDASR